jgi:hypothetical protein
MFGPGRRVARRTARRTARRQMYLQDAMSGGYDEPSYDEPSYHEPPATPQQPQYLVELEKLGELKAAGVIDDAEFEAKKKQLLGI